MSEQNKHMSPEDLVMFANNLAFGHCPSIYACDGLLFLLNTIFDQVKENQTQALESIEDLREALFNQCSMYGQAARTQFIDTIAERYHATNYNQDGSDLIDQLREEVASQKPSYAESVIEEPVKPNILDLSNHPTAEDECLDLAKQLSNLIHSDMIPEGLKNHIVDGLGELEQPLEVVDSPEYIAKVLCDNGGKK